MIFYLLVLLVLIILNIKFSKDGFDDYIGREQTTCIKGIFTIIIFLSHYNSYAGINSLSNGMNGIYYSFFSHISQLMVVPFLFYSGYSICYSIVNKKDYIKKFPKSRILKVLIMFDLAVLFYLIMNIIMKNQYDFKTIILSFSGWRSIGNSNWFIFSLLGLYVITYIVFRFMEKKINLKSLILVTIFTIMFIVTLSIKKDSWWYDILLSYPFGMFIFYFKDKIFKILKSRWILSLIISLVIFSILYIFKKYIIVYELVACAFALIIIVVNSKIKISNKILLFIGNLSFEVYILQRIPDTILRKYIPGHAIIMCIVCFSITLLISFGFNKVTKFIFKKLSI